MEALAYHLIGHELKTETDLGTYRNRNRLEPWHKLVDEDTLGQLLRGEMPPNVDALEHQWISIAIWPDEPVPGLDEKTMRVDAIGEGAIRIVLRNPSKTIILPFVLDFRHGRAHTHSTTEGFAARRRFSQMRQMSERTRRSFIAYSAMGSRN